MSKYTNPTKKHDFILLYDVVDGNPNGDPDADNLPRTDAETQQGIITFPPSGQPATSGGG